LNGLDTLSECCDAGTRVVVIGQTNDIVFYRELIRRGVSDYMIAPISTMDVLRTICGLFSARNAEPLGRIVAVVGAKGGVGASTVAHNVAWSTARDLMMESVVTDLDLAFGTAGLDYNQDPQQGIADAVLSPDRIDTAFIDRLLSKCTDRLSLLAAPATLERAYDFSSEAFDAVFDALRASIPCIVLDVPHQWNAWTQRTLVNADDILIVAAPDLANLRNAKNLFDFLRAAPLTTLTVLPQSSGAKKAKSSLPNLPGVRIEPPVIIPFDPQVFGAAANNGQMIAEMSANHRTAATFKLLAQLLTRRPDVKKSNSGLLTPLLRKLLKRQ
jgi:pilus assembly protein CpaE